MSQNTGFVHFIAQADAVSHTLLAILVMMSLTTWFLIFTKTWHYWQIRRHAKHFQQFFWQAENMQVVDRHLAQQGIHDPFSHVTRHGLSAIHQYAAKTGNSLIATGSADEFLTRALRRAIHQDTARLEHGHTVLASIASSAPFIGLFGTVWGIYHALIAISATGESTLDKVAAPVGEALIMTAVGLAVAIPAVLAYNVFSRKNRMILTELDGFAHDLFAFMSTGNSNIQEHK